MTCFGATNGGLPCGMRGPGDPFDPSGSLGVELQLVLAGLAGPDDIDLEVGPALGIGLEPDHQDFAVIEGEAELPAIGASGRRRPRGDRSGPRGSWQLGGDREAAW